MKAIVKVERNRGGIQVVDIAPPVMKEYDVLVKIRNASICGSDVHAYNFAPTHHFIEPPIIMGHECSGEVVDVGARVSHFKPGERVVIEAIDYCGNCEPCLKGLTNICNAFKIRGMHCDGVFTEYVAVSQNYLHKIPDTLSFETACLVEPTSVLAHAILERSTIKPGDLVLVTGPGPIGIIAAQMVKVVGAEPVVVGIDSDEHARLPIARQLNIQTINVSRTSITDALNKMYDRETVHATIECSGASSVFQTSLDVVVKGGNVTLVGLFPELVRANLSIAVRKEISIYASFSSTWIDFERAISLLEQGKIKTDPLVRHYDPIDAVRAFEDAIAKKVPKPVFTF